MVPTYNGWEDAPEDEREALELWEATSQPGLAAARKPRASQMAGIAGGESEIRS